MIEIFKRGNKESRENGEKREVERKGREEEREREGEVFPFLRDTHRAGATNP